MATAGPWKSLKNAALHPSLLRALTTTLSFPHMTPVQAAAIPPLLSTKDVCVDAETGSGKTLSYLVPIAQTLLFRLCAKPSAAVRALILLPTRELAAQVHKVAVQLFNALPGDLTAVALIGGAGGNFMPDEHMQRDMRVVVATPGRLAAVLVGGGMNVNALEMLVLDEADRLLDMGFAVTLTDILTRLPRQRRTGIYSATQTKEVDALARAGLRNPVRVAVKVAIKGEHLERVEKRRIPASLRCEYSVVSHRDRLAYFMMLLSTNRDKKFIVYFMTCAYVDYIKRLPLEDMVRKVGACDASARRLFCALHGKMSQTRREKALTQFAQSKNGVLMCTDVAARGIDIPDVDWVVQFDPPQDPDAYIHRVGRTARLGREGRALIFLAPSEDAYAEFLQVRKCPVACMKDEIMHKEGENEAGHGSGEKLAVSKEVVNVVSSMIRAAVLADRAVLEASEAAFLSYVRAYKEHRCRFLFKIEDLDIDSVADAFGLLRLPRFHEFTKLRKKITLRRDETINIRDIAFKDKTREKQRQAKIKDAVENKAQWREKLQARSKKNVKKNVKKKRLADGIERAASGQKRKAMDDAGDVDDFSTAAAQLRKVKRGKMSQSDFEKATGITHALVEE